VLLAAETACKRGKPMFFIIIIPHEISAILPTSFCIFEKITTENKKI
jgi:hypothetical protein